MPTIPDNLEDRHRMVRAGFILKGTSLAAWCRENGVKHQNAHKAIIGTWTGPKAKSLLTRIMIAAGIDDDA